MGQEAEESITVSRLARSRVEEVAQITKRVTEEAKRASQQAVRQAEQLSKTIEETARTSAAAFNKAITEAAEAEMASLNISRGWAMLESRLPTETCLVFIR